MPMERRTRAPAPSACSTARKTLRRVRGTDISSSSLASAAGAGAGGAAFVVVVSNNRDESSIWICETAAATEDTLTVISLSEL